MQLNNRADYRDWLRGALGVLRATDLRDPSAKRGDPAPSMPHPSNSLLNQAIYNAGAAVNSECGIELGTTDPYRLSVAAYTADGPARLELTPAGLTPHTAPGSLEQCRRVVWEDSAGTFSRVWSVTLEELNTQDRLYENEPPSTPRQYAIEGTTLWLLPAPVAAGTLQFEGGFGMLAPVGDLEGYEGIPLNYIPDVLWIALVELGDLAPNDVEMQARADRARPRADKAIIKISEWYSTRLADHQPSLTFESHRRGSFVRRRRV